MHFHSSTILSGIIAKAQELNYQVLICESGKDAESERVNTTALINTGIDGLLVSLSNNNFSEDFFSEAHWDESKWDCFAKHKGLPLWVVELSSSGSFVREWTLEIDNI